MSALWKMAVMEKKKDSTGLPVKSDHSDAGPFRDVPNPGNISRLLYIQKTGIITSNNRLFTGRSQQQNAGF